MAVVFPGTVEELTSIVKLLNRNKITFIARGAGTGLSGGAVPQDKSVIIEMARFKDIHEVDFRGINTQATLNGTVSKIPTILLSVCFR